MLVFFSFKIQNLLQTVGSRLWYPVQQTRLPCHTLLKSHRSPCFETLQTRETHHSQGQFYCSVCNSINATYKKNEEKHQQFI